MKVSEIRFSDVSIFKLDSAGNTVVELVVSSCNGYPVSNIDDPVSINNEPVRADSPIQLRTEPVRVAPNLLLLILY